MINQELKPMFSYSLFPIIIVLFILVINLFLYFKTKQKKKIIKPPIKNLFEIKNYYRQKLFVLEQKVNQKIITNRKAYQELSMIIRSFVSEVTQINVKNYSLKEIKKINISSLSSLIEEFYYPQFSRKGRGNIYDSIRKSRKVIEKWQ